MAKNKTIGTLNDYIKANRKASREEEIRMYGKPIAHRTTTFKSKKQYNRQRDRQVPLFLYIYSSFWLCLLYLFINS